MAAVVQPKARLARRPFVTNRDIKINSNKLFYSTRLALDPRLESALELLQLGEDLFVPAPDLGLVHVTSSAGLCLAG